MLTIRKFASIPGGTDLTALYRAEVGDYPKFFKMDTACKLGFLLAERLADEPRFTPREDRAVLMFSTCGSLCNDRHYEETVREFPSPSLFVYTLPNIITGEIAIRNKYEGETSAYVLERFDPETFVALVEQAFQDVNGVEAQPFVAEEGRVVIDIGRGHPVQVQGVDQFELDLID